MKKQYTVPTADLYAYDMEDTLLVSGILGLLISQGENDADLPSNWIA